jgi:hypothetical protein
MEDEGRTAHVVLARADGTVLGRLPPLEVSEPWWMAAAALVEGVRERDGLDIVVLRLLDADRPHPPGGNVTYLAEVAGQAAAEPWEGSVEEHPRTPAFARPGGPAADLAWAEAAMAAQGIAPTGPPRQLRTWCLSSLWRLPTSEGPLWLKIVPSFFARESGLLARLSGHPTPRVIAAEGPRLLMRDIPSDGTLAEDPAALAAMVSRLVGLQADFIGRTAELFALGLPDWRSPVAIPALEAAARAVAPELRPEDRALVERFIAGLPRRFAAIAACGLPDTLVHGDFHPGNAGGTPDDVVLLDFTDCIVGHPLLDMPTFVGRVPPPLQPEIRAAWLRAWKRALPEADPERAACLLAPVATARQALVHIDLLASIAPAEHPYFARVPGRWIERTLEILRAEDQAG